MDETFSEAVTVSAGMQLSYNISGLMAYSAYNVSVRATNQYGAGDFSEEVTVRTEEGGECELHCVRGICSEGAGSASILPSVNNMQVCSSPCSVLHILDVSFSQFWLHSLQILHAHS